MTTRTANLPAGSQPPKALQISLWIVQSLLACAFLMAGVTKTTQPIEALAHSMPWTTAIPAGLVRFIGVSEFLGGLGLILPALTRVKPGLTALAGAGLVTIMVLAALFHVSRGEFAALPFNLVLGGLSAFVAWGRWKKAPIAPR